MPTAKLTVQEAWTAVMRDVQAIGKDSTNTQQHFKFRGVDAVMNAVGPVLREHGVTVLPARIVDVREERYETKNKTAMHSVIVIIEWMIHGPAGDVMTAASVGEAADSGDKAASKAHSVAYRTLLLEALCIPTGDPDPDATTAERGSQGGDYGDADQPRQDAPPPDPRTKLWEDIIKRGTAAGWTTQQIQQDYLTRHGHAINDPIDVATPAELTAYHHTLPTPPPAPAADPPAATEEPK